MIFVIFLGTTTLLHDCQHLNRYETPPCSLVGFGGNQIKVKLYFLTFYNYSGGAHSEGADSEGADSEGAHSEGADSARVGAHRKGAHIEGEDSVEADSVERTAWERTRERTAWERTARGASARKVSKLRSDRTARERAQWGPQHSKTRQAREAQRGSELSGELSTTHQ
jgi:hypothetical protein